MRTIPAIIALLLTNQVAHAQPAKKRIEPPEGLGIGVVLGVPTGISVGYRISSTRAFSTAVAWSAPQNSLHVHVDYLFEMTQIVDPNAPMYQFPLYAGFGARIQVDPEPNNVSSPLFGLRAPIGLTFLPQVAPFEVFAELVPVMSLYPSTQVSFDGAIGARYYF